MTDWRNRITGSGEEAPDQLLANPRNFRRHPKHQQDALRGVLNEVGWVQEVVVNTVTGHLVDGHLRVELALRDGAESVPVKYVELSEAEEALVLATLDPIGALAFSDRETLDALLRDVSTGDAALQEMLANLAEQEGVVPRETGAATDPWAEWDGMPEYAHEDLRPVKQITVSFASPEDVEAFARLVGQPVSMTTRSIWYPQAERTSYMDKAYLPEEASA